MAGHENRTHRVTTQEIHNCSSFLGGATEQDFHFHISFGKVNGADHATHAASIARSNPDVDTFAIARLRIFEVTVIERIDHCGISRMRRPLGSIDRNAARGDQVLDKCPEVR